MSGRELVLFVFVMGSTARIAGAGIVTLQPGAFAGKDIWTTSAYSYAPGGGGPGGGLANDRLRVGGWADEYDSLLQFDLAGLPRTALAATLTLYPTAPVSGSPTPMYLDRITQAWDWRTGGTGSDRDRLWWADKPTATQVRAESLPAPTPGRPYTIDVTDLYNGWQSGNIPNYGLQLRPTATSNNWSEFFSSRYVIDSSLRPKLTISAAPATVVPSSIAPHGGKLSGNIDPGNQVTVVITHGWEPGESYDRPLAWVDEMKSAIGSAPIPLGINGVNTVSWTWKDAFTPSDGIIGLLNKEFAYADAQTEYQGLILGRSLLQAGAKNVHFIGHSLGTHVNAIAAEYLINHGVAVVQATVLDRPLGFHMGNDVAEMEDHFFSSTMKGVGWIDNYFGGDRIAHPPATGSPISLSRSYNLQVPGSHPEVHDWYTGTVGSKKGFFWSLEGGGDGKRPVSTLQPEKLYQTTPAVNFQDAGWSVSSNSVMSPTSVTLIQHSPAFLWNWEAIPDNALAIAFDLMWVKGSDENFLQLSFGENILFSIAGDAFDDGDIIHAELIPISQFSHQTDILQFSLYDGGVVSGAQVVVSNVRYVSELPEPPYGMLLVPILWALLIRRNGHRFGELSSRKVPS